jgi:predicted dehydrogenase
VRGRWHNEEECGSGLLLAKSCHDLDLMCWLNNITEPDKISSFGARAHFVPEKAPKDSAERCFDCKYLETCPYSAKTAHLNLADAANVTWAGIGKPIKDITVQDKIDYLNTSIFGQCAYKIESTLVDRQVVSVMFKNGSIGTLNMLGGTTKGGRTVHITGTKGEIQGYWESNVFTLRVYDGVNQRFTEQEFDVSEQVKTGHMGGDDCIMRDVIKFLNNDFSSFSITNIEDSINGHLCVYGAEESRKSGRIISIDDLRR